MPGELRGRRIAILAADGVEKSELEESGGRSFADGRHAVREEQPSTA